MQKIIIKLIKYFFIISIFLTLVGASLYFYRLSQRPAQTSIEENLWQGIRYQRIALTKPHKIIIHLAEVDLKKKGIQFLVSAPEKPIKLDINAQTTSHFLEKNKLQLAINGSFFTPFHSHGPFDYYPHEGDPVDTLGLAISSGQIYSNDFPDWAVFCASKSHVNISRSGCSKGTQQAIAGKELIIKQGKLNTSHLTSRYAKGTHPRSAIAINKDKTKVWFIVVDGRQKNYSKGISLDELGKLLIQFGAYNAINLDGGGSSTLVTQRNTKARLLNAPFHTKIPMNERPVANHLGVYALPFSK